MSKSIARYIRYAVVSLWILVMIGCASKQDSEAFPEPEKMEPMIVFWENVYSKWDTHTVVFHDNVYMDVVYRELPIAVGDQRTIDIEREKISIMLDQIEFQSVVDASLSAEQKKIKAKLKKAGGSKALVGISERVRAQRGLKSRFKDGLERSHAYLPYFKAAFKERGMPEELAYLPHVESSFVNHARSKVGAAGMWQFMPSTARSFLPMRGNVIDGRIDPFIASRGAAAYLKENYDVVKSWPLALTGYNHGIGGMLKAKNIHGDNIDEIVYKYDGPRFGFASRNFYAEFLAAKRISESPKKYFSSLRFSSSLPIEGIVLYSPLTLDVLAEKTGVAMYRLIELNPVWLDQIKNNRVAIPSGVEVWLPKGTYKKASDKSFGRLADIQP